MARKRILVVEDNEDNRRILLYRLRKIGDFEILEAGNGEQAVAEVERGAPDLIFMDLKMPVMDGFELVKAVRQRPEWNEMRILMVTTENGVDEVVRAMRAGANEYLMKPFDIDDVRAKLALMGLV